MCFKNAKYVINKLITYICSFKNAFHMGSIGFGPIDGNVGYFKRIEKDYIISVSEATTLTRNYANINITPIEGTQVRFSVTIYDVAAYYGAFTNPPALKSPDVLPSNVFEVGGTPMKDISTVIPKNTGWYRLIHWYGGVYFLESYNRFIPTNIFLHKFYFESGWASVTQGSNDEYNSYDIDFGFSSSGQTTTISRNMLYLSVRKIGSYNSPFTKFRIARGTEELYKLKNNANSWMHYYSLFIEVYYAANNIEMSTCRVFTDNLINEVVRIDNTSRVPDGNNDVLIGSEVTPTLIGTNVTIS